MTRWLVRLLLLLWALSGQAAVLPLDAAGTAPLGRHAAQLVEHGGAMTLEEALAAQRAGRFAAAVAAVPKFGIGAPPVWLHLALDNRAGAGQLRHIVAGVLWMDRLDVYLLRDAQLVGHVAAGDGALGRQAPVGSLGFVIEHVFEPGVTEIFVRAESPDPLLVPLRLLARDFAVWWLPCRPEALTVAELRGWLEEDE